MNHMSSVLLHCSIFDIRPSPPPTSNTQGEINGRILSLHLQSTTNISTPKHIGRKRNRQGIFAPHFHVSFPEMSPALIDSGAQSQALQTPPHLSGPLISSQYLPDDRSSAFVSMNRSDGVNPNFQFSAASMSKPVVTDNPAFRPVPALSRPRMAKTRKSQHGRATVAPEPRKSDGTFNRIRPISDYYKPPPSSSGMYPGESALLGGDRNVNRGNDLESSILDEIKNLRLLDDQGAGVDASSSSKHFNVTGDSQTNIGFGRGDDDGSGHSSLLAGIPNDLNKLNINDPVVTPLNHISFGPQGNRHFEFGHREKESKSVASSMADTITNRMRNLVVEASHNANEETKLSHGREAFGGEPHSMILDDLGKLKLGEDLKESDCYYEGLSSVKTKAPQHRADYGTQSKHQFVFTSKLDSSGTPYGEFNTPNTKGTSSLAQPWGGTNIFSKESSFEDKPEPSESYSPMEVSPYQEICPDNQSFRDTSSTSKGSVHVEESLTSNNHQPAYGDILDEDLISATEHLGINEARNMNYDEGADQVSVCSFNGSIGVQASSEDSVSAVETESFKSATDLSEISEQSEEISSRLNDEVSTRDSKGQFFSASSSELKGEIPFTFSASIIDQVAPATRNQKKKIRPKVGHDPHSSLKDTVLSDASSTIHFSSVSRGSSPFNTRNEDISAYHHRKGPSVGVEKTQLVKQETPCPSATAFAAKEACEKWRLRGNQAYTNGELDKAEDCYTQGVNCISKGEASRDGLRALMLCYSNRAAIRMALQKFRDALTDCRAAAEIDPNFFKVHIRTANCYLAMGEVAEASSLLMKLLQSGTEACMDRKFMLEASESIEKAQKVTRCIDHSVQLLRHKTLSNAKDSMQTIDEGLTISPYSEKLLQMKVEALFMMQRYQEVIELCEQTLQTAEKNSPVLVSENQSSHLDPSEVLNKYSFLIWRYSFIFNSYYCLGKLEEGLDFLDKRSELRSIQDRCGTQAVESLIPLLVRARELLKHKSAGNAAYQGGRHAEAVEHYTAALSCSAESRPFAAICFGNRAAAYQALGQIPDAIADCNLAIALDRSYLKAISRRATLFEMIRDYEEASNDVQRIVSLLTKEAEENVNRPVNFQTDLRQAHMRLAYVEEQASKGPLLDFYVILGVEPSSATSADLKKAYRKAALRHHPDKACQLLTRGENVDDGLWKEMCEEVQKEADRLFKMIGEAYSVLSDPAKRSRYEEEVRNNLKRTGGTGGSRMRSEGQSFSYQRNSSGRTAWRSPGSPNQRFEPSTRSSRFH